MISNPKNQRRCLQNILSPTTWKMQSRQGKGSMGGGDDGRKKASNLNCTFLPVCLLSAWSAVVGAEVGRGGVRTRRKGIRATGAQSCGTTVPERSHVMGQRSAPRSEGPRIRADTMLPSERWKLTTAPGEYVSMPSTFMAELRKTNCSA